MAKAYVIFTEDVHDQDAMNTYAGKAVPTLMSAGAGILVAGPPAEVLEGDWHGTQTVLLEFESIEAAKAWYDSDEYQAIIGERHGAADSHAAIFEGFSM